MYMCMATVARKRGPIVSAANFSFFVSISSVCGPSYAWASWEVMRRIMLVTASQRLMVKKSRGICMVYSSCIMYRMVVVGSCVVSSCSMVTGLPVAFARAQAMALERGCPLFRLSGIVCPFLRVGL